MSVKQEILNWCDKVEIAVTQGKFEGKRDIVGHSHGKTKPSHIITRRRKKPSQRRQPKWGHK